MCALYFAKCMVFTENILDREDIVQHNDGDTTVNVTVTHGSAIVQMPAPEDLPGLRRQHFHFLQVSVILVSVTEKN